MVKNRTYPQAKITPSSILGDCVHIYSRHFYLPFKKIKIINEEDCPVFLYTGDAKDNSSAVVVKSSELQCLKNKFTNISKNSKISGTHIHIQSEVKIRENNIKKVNLTGRHKSQELKLNSFTYVALIKEESNIINSQDYASLVEKKENLDFDENGLITVD